MSWTEFYHARDLIGLSKLCRRKYLIFMIARRQNDTFAKMLDDSCRVLTLVWLGPEPLTLGGNPLRFSLAAFRRCYIRVGGARAREIVGCSGTLSCS